MSKLGNSFVVGMVIGTIIGTIMFLLSIIVSPMIMSHYNIKASTEDGRFVIISAFVAFLIGFVVNFVYNEREY